MLHYFRTRKCIKDTDVELQSCAGVSWNARECTLNKCTGNDDKIDILLFDIF